MLVTRAAVHSLHVVFKIPYTYDFIRKIPPPPQTHIGSIKKAGPDTKMESLLLIACLRTEAVTETLMLRSTEFAKNSDSVFSRSEICP